MTATNPRGREQHHAVLVDPVCASERGHNLPLLLDCRDFLAKELGIETEVHVSDSLPPDVCERTGVHATFPFAYAHEDQLRKNMGLTHVRSRGNVRQRLAKRFSFLMADLGAAHIIFPYADYFGVLACRDALRVVEEPSRVRISLRFIGVMENAAPAGVPAAESLAEAVSDLRGRGVLLTLAAESAPYAAVLTDRFRDFVDVVAPLAPTWVRRGCLPTQADRVPFAYCPGTGRGDKGFILLPEVVSRYRRLYPSSPLEFVCQAPGASRDNDLHNAQVRLQALPGVTVLPSMVSADHMAQLYGDCAFVLLPYDPSTYRLRSSASLADAIGAEAPVVTLSGTGLEAVVSYYGLGAVAPDVESLVSACHDVMLRPRSSWARSCRSALRRYDRDTVVAWRDWLGKGQ